MTWAATATASVAVATLGAGYMGAQGAQSSAKKANKKNKKIADAQLAEDKRQFDLSHASTEEERARIQANYDREFATNDARYNEAAQNERDRYNTERGTEQERYNTEQGQYAAQFGRDEDRYQAEQRQYLDRMGVDASRYKDTQDQYAAQFGRDETRYQSGLVRDDALSTSRRGREDTINKQLQGRFDTVRGENVARFDPYSQAGSAALNEQKALLGLSGKEAEAAAMSRFNESPGLAFLRDRQERALLRNASAMGGLRGGNVQTALQEQAFGRAQTDYDQRFNRLGALSDRGMGAGSEISRMGAGPNYVTTGADQGVA